MRMRMRVGVVGAKRLGMYAYHGEVERRVIPQVIPQLRHALLRRATALYTRQCAREVGTDGMCSRDDEGGCALTALTALTSLVPGFCADECATAMLMTALFAGHGLCTRGLLSRIRTTRICLPRQVVHSNKSSSAPTRTRKINGTNAGTTHSLAPRGMLTSTPPSPPPLTAVPPWMTRGSVHHVVCTGAGHRPGQDDAIVGQRAEERRSGVCSTRAVHDRN